MTRELYSLPVRVYFQDTDAVGVVFHANYMNFLERARTEWLRERGGTDVRRLMTDWGLAIVIRALNLEYLKPAYLDDLLLVSVALTEIGRSRMVFTQQICRGADVLVKAEVCVVCVSCVSFTPIPVPDFFKQLALLEVGSK